MMAVTILKGDCREILRTLPENSVHCVVTSPPYFGLRDYGVDGQIGIEPTPAAFVDKIVNVFRDLRRVLRSDGTVWLNLGDSYASGGRGGGASGSKQKTNLGALLGPKKAPDGYKSKDLIGIPWRIAFALQADGWWLRQDIIWNKPNPMPESVTDRCTKSHEYIFLLSKSERYFYDAQAIAEDAVREPMPMQASAQAAMLKSLGPMSRGNGINHQFADPTRLWAENGKRNKRSVWTVATQPFSGAHFATFPPALIEPCILAGCPQGGTVIDPFGGAGTTGMVADRLRRHAILIELNPEYADLAEKRILDDSGMFSQVTND